mgnify:CR=1
MAKGTSKEGNMVYDEVFKSLPEEKQKELTHKKIDFAKMAGIVL